ncbi:MAG: hypothetical protein FJY85_03680 [Deltaproteobacteria bacterium]|nr:hypothetical protein [Deltaproteobacteria bacterium]
MLKKYFKLAISAIIAATVSCPSGAVNAFEIFPRPDAQYTVKRGDTLYGVAGYYYSDPALWPFLWNQNPSILIKDKGAAPSRQPLTPGTKINLYAHRTASNVVTEHYEVPTGIPDDVAYLVDRIPRKGIPYSKQYFKYKLSSRPTTVWGYIVSSPEVDKAHFLERDLVYVRFRPSKKQVILVGDRFGVYREKGPLSAPLNPDKSVGYLNEIVGEIEITSTSHDLATAIIIDSFVELAVGDKICLFTPREREIVPSKTHRMLVGTVLQSASRDTWYRDVHHLENDIVYINRGECDGMKEGMLLNIYRATHPIPDPYFPNRYVSIPDRYVGEGMVLKAFDKNSTVIITRMREEITAGDLIKSVSD